MMATFEFARTFMTMELITEGARSGCRGYTDSTGKYWPGAIIATTPQQQTTNATNAVMSYLANLGISGESVVVNVNNPDPNETTVIVSVPVSNVSWVPNPLFTAGGTLVGKFTLTVETHQ
jgi:hypothetical protein